MCRKFFLLTSFVVVLSLVGSAGAQPTGKLLIEYWNDIGGTVLSDLYDNALFPDSPDDSGYLTAFDLPYDPPYGDNYGARIRGYLYPPETGDYNFWIAGDDACEFLLSTDDDPANVVRIVWIDGWCDAYDWDNTGGSDNPDQASAAPVTLQAGQKYYIEGGLKEGGGGDGIAVAWQGPGIADRAVIAGDYLSQWLMLTARKPIPADGAVDADVLTLEWTAGDTAVSHKVYLSTDATVDESDLLAEGPLALQFADLAPGADYYWRVDEVDADGAVIEGDLWTFSTLPLEAHFPGPDDGAKDVALDAKLSWTAGKGAVMHDVYFGTDEAAVAASDPSTFQGKLMDASFDPGPLEPFTSYYWKVDEFAVVATNPGPVWSFQSFDPDKASGPSPANGAADVDSMPVLTWMAGETAFQHEVFFGTDADLVAASDASVSQGPLTEASFAPAEALERGITYYWKVDVSTGAVRDSVIHSGNLWSFTVIDRNTNNWAATVAGDAPGYLDTFVEDGLYDIGTFSGDITYEFVVRSNPDETEASMCLIGRRQFGDTQAGLKYEQWNNTGTYGATLFGVVDLDYGVPTAPGEYTVLTFVSSEDAGTTKLYENGVLAGSVDAAITLSGLVGIGYGAQGADGTGVFDNFDGAIFGVAIYDTALSDDVIAKHSDSYFTPIAITDPDLLIYYDFETGEGTTVLDQSGHGNHSQFMGNPEWATGIFGGCISIDIADLDYIQTVAPLNIVSNTVTVTGWVKHDESPAAWSGILTHRGTTPGCLGLQHNGVELRYMWGADVYWDVSSGLEMPNGEWYFAALAISPEQGKLYLNGIGAEQTLTNVAPHEPTNFDSLIRVGRDHNDDRIMTSLIDEVRFYNKTLTDVEILKVMGTVSDVTAPGDIVQGVPNDGDWPGAETPDLAIDDNTATKYLHFKGDFDPDPGTGGTGIQVTPAAGPTIVTGLTLTTANDVPGRDPIAFELSGSNQGIDGPYELIASGDIVDFAQETEWPRFTMNATAISFENDVAYAHYQLIFTAIRGPVGGSVNSMQIAEIELLGVPAPAALLAVNINFQSLTQGSGEVPQGYLPDYGEAFADRGNGFSYGWSRDIQGDSRDRDSANAVDQRYDTLNHLQKGEDAVWEIELPNGVYNVFMVNGDPDNTDQINNFDVEGVVVVDPDGEDNFDEYNVTVVVSDGLLTIKPADGSANCKIMFVDIAAPVPPIVHYKLDDGEGTIAVDSANGLDGILMGDPQWAIGVIGGALDFDGDGDYVDCGTNDVLNNLSDAITVSAWVNIRSVTTTWMGIVMKGETAWRLGVNGDTTGIHWGFSGGDRGWQQANSVTELPLNEWHHIAGTCEKNVGGIVYVDGVAEAENPDPDGPAINEMPLLLGENPEALGRLLDGILDDVRIYDRALSAAEISQLATLEPPANILANGGFEDGVPDPWSTYGDATLEVVQELAGAAVPEAPIEGGSCLHVVVGSAGANFWDAGLQHAGHVFEAGKQYTLSVFLKCKEGTLDINLKPERGEDPWEGYGDQIFTMTDTWAEYSITTPVIEAEVVPATITFHIAFAPGEFWVDDARFVEVQ